MIILHSKKYDNAAPRSYNSISTKITTVGIIELQKEILPLGQ
jgi:hypothetical protein